MQSKPPSLKLITEKINSVLIQDTRIVAAYLLGSIVGGRLHPQSDIDLAIFPDPPKTYPTSDRLLLAARLQDELPLRSISVFWVCVTLSIQPRQLFTASVSILAIGLKQIFSPQPVWHFTLN